jgi:general secretion pathway protein G
MVIEHGCRQAFNRVGKESRMKRNIQCARKGFTLIEVLLVIVIVVSLATIAAVALWPAREEAKQDLTRLKIEKVMAAVERYASKLGYPTAEQGLKALLERPQFEKPEMDKDWHGPYCSSDDLKDEWGNDLVYKLEDVDTGSGTTRKAPRIHSVGPNTNDENGDGDDIKDKNWQGETAGK